MTSYKKLSKEQGRAIKDSIKGQGKKLQDAAEYLKMDPGGFSHRLNGQLGLSPARAKKLYEFSGDDSNLDFLLDYEKLGGSKPLIPKRLNPQQRAWLSLYEETQKALLPIYLKQDNRTRSEIISGLETLIEQYQHKE
ncbi:hypothetical protein HOC80_01660 [archaeon]|jgi:hypothetical protein|nr:hypothetical protein [archaeon]